jgi:alpha-D-ribose 1-methylphosphonate 5-triphosphate synthase subunit PhnL
MTNASLPDPTTVIAARSIGKAFVLHPQGGARLPVLNAVDLDVAAGECVALAGPSGTGKSTLLRCLYANYGPTSGTVWVRHRDSLVDLSNASAREVLEIRIHTIGWVSQFLRVIPRVPAIDIVAEPVAAQGHSLADGRERAVELLRRLNVPERLWMLAPSTFSGGEQQRVNVARGLAAGHPILLVDEPTASLDPDNRDVVIALLAEACAAGAAVVGIFHDATVRDRIATRTFNLSPINDELPEDLAS